MANIEEIDLTPDILSVANSARKIYSEGKHAVFIASIRRLVDMIRAGGERVAIKAAEQYGRSERSDQTPEEILALARRFRGVEMASREELNPAIEALEMDLASQKPDTEIYQLISDSIAAGKGCLSEVRSLQDKLTKLAEVRTHALTRNLQALAVNGEVDWAELSREHIARYPKIRARLAE
jgi:hypothetical protein